MSTNKTVNGTSKADSNSSNTNRSDADARKTTPDPELTSTIEFKAFAINSSSDALTTPDALETKTDSSAPLKTTFDKMSTNKTGNRNSKVDPNSSNTIRSDAWRTTPKLSSTIQSKPFAIKTNSDALTTSEEFETEADSLAPMQNTKTTSDVSSDVSMKTESTDSLTTISDDPDLLSTLSGETTEIPTRTSTTRIRTTRIHIPTIKGRLQPKPTELPPPPVVTTPKNAAGSYDQSYIWMINLIILILWLINITPFIRKIFKGKSENNKKVINKKSISVSEDLSKLSLDEKKN